jgi:parallel beta-helix repeat protein
MGRNCGFSSTGVFAHAAQLGLMTLLALVANAAVASEYCVGSVAEIDAALADARSDSSALFTTTIMLKQGTYHIAGSGLYGSHYPNVYYHALEILGGYNSDCTVRNVQVANTIFDGDGSAADIDIRPLDSLLIEGIRWQNFGAPTYSAAIEIAGAADNVSVQIRDNAFLGTSVYVNQGVDIADASGMNVEFVNNLVTGVGANVSGAVNLFAATSLRFVGNTIADNLAVQGVRATDCSDVAFVDNIGWNNTGDDFRVVDDSNNPMAASFTNNIYQGITANTVVDSNNLPGADPLFVNAATGNYRLQAASPAVNSGYISNSMADVDLDGNARVVGSTVDRGAYESAFDDTIPTTITVTNANDSGAGSLRQAILDANNNADFTFINFNISGTCPIEIAPDTADLPTISHGVRIDGFSQPGSAANTHAKGDNAQRCIVLSGKYGRKYGLNFNGGSSDQFWVQGLAFSYFSPSTSLGNGAAVRLSSGRNGLIWGNQFGGTMKTPTGTQALSPSDTNILLTSVSNATSVGGSAPAQRNVIAAAKGDGVLVTSVTAGTFTFSSVNNDIAGNLIGSDRDESSNAGNHVGVHVKTSGNTVSDNVIINSGQDGVLLEGTGAYNNTIQDNRIGVSDLFCGPLACFEQAAGNGRDGLLLSYGPHDNIVYVNRIHDNTARGIEIGSSSGAVSAHNWLIGNSLYSNGGQGTLFNAYNGADNDADAAAADMANRGLNYPVITRAYGGTKKGVVEGTLSSTNGSYVLDVFSSAQADSGYPLGEGDLYHRSYYSVTINNAVSGQNGSQSFRVPFTSTLSLASRVITLTAADTVTGDTSELSAPVAYECDVIFENDFSDPNGDKCP